jgi:hypothetical protein
MTKTLPKEIASLIHHITLNEQGWWDKTIQRLIISALGSVENKQLTIEKIVKFVQENYDTHIDNDKVKKQIEKLCSSKAILKVDKDTFLLSESELNSFNKDISKYEETEIKVQFEFLEIIKKGNSLVGLPSELILKDRLKLQERIESLFSNC